MKNLHVKTMAVLIAATLIGGTAVTATGAMVKDSLNDDVNIVVASSRNYSESDEYSKDSNHEKEERDRKGSEQEQEDRDGNEPDDDKGRYETRVNNVTLVEAIKIATGDTPGEVIEVEFERGRYEVKLRTKDGYKKEIYVSAKDGTVVRRK